MLSDVLFGNAGGLGGTSLPNTKFSCAIASVVDVAVVSDTALLANAPEIFDPNSTLFPRILADNL